MLIRRTFIRQLSLGSLGLGTLPMLPGCLSRDNSEKKEIKRRFLRSTPEAQGVDSGGIANLLDAIEASGIEFHSLMVLRHGHVIAEGWWAPYKSDYIHSLYSLSKSFTSTAIGMAADEGLLSVEDYVLSFFPRDYAPESVSDNLAAMKVKDLLTMSTGHAEGTLYYMSSQPEGIWAKGFLARPVEFEPGTRFMYETGATFMLSAILQRISGQKLFDYLRPRLFEPLDIQGADWEENPEGINVGGYGLRIKTEDIAKLGQLYLQKGLWDGQRIISEQWVRDAAGKQVDSRPGNPEDDISVSDWAQGYGYQFWRCRPKNAYRADGAFGQFSIVLPDLDAVIAITSESSDMQLSMNLLWEHLLPAFREVPSLPEDRVAQQQLEAKLRSLALPTAGSAQFSPLQQKISGQTYRLEDNDYGAQSLRLDFSEESCVFNLAHRKGEYIVHCSFDHWNDENEKANVFDQSTSIIRQFVPTRLAAHAGWKDQSTLLFDWIYVETAHSEVLQLSFKGDSVEISFKESSNGVLEAKRDKPGLKGILMT